jgi:hypothetical protein
MYSTNGVNRIVYRILVGKPEEKIPIGKPRGRLVDNIKLYQRDRVEWYGLN